VVGAAVPSDNSLPKVDVTLGKQPLIGNAPPSEGTSLEFGGSLVQPPSSGSMMGRTLRLDGQAIKAKGVSPIVVPAGAKTTRSHVQPQVEMKPGGAGRTSAPVLPVLGAD
jgi:hypothetical protein